ncbi:MAG TPA: 50S ribosomal protein L29 [Lentisphaeria bacterium]|nr:MAG: 50S ribosomal protein L29 [Lentisphaerae bacterium GWF2_38_69]HBM16284.1 50S ribosomal protein L29 [Lentisphaeria bacterium]
MKKMAQIREMSDAELKSAISDLEKEKYNLKMQAKTGQLEKSARIGQAKKEIAMIKTEQSSRAKNPGK